MRHSLIRTERLDLAPLSLEEAHALVDGRAPLGARWADDYPTDGSLVAASYVVTAEREQRDLGAFGTYQIVRREDNRTIGDCGFLGPPDAAGVVQVAYGIVPSARGRGYATEALEALIGYAFTHDRVTAVRAETAQDNVASRRVMEKAGMACVDESGETVIFEG